MFQKNHVCLKCEPLEALLYSAGCTKKEASLGSKKILKAFRMIKLEDTIRDEAFHRKVIAKVLSIPFIARLPRTMRRKLRQLNVEVKRLENSCSDPVAYVEKLSVFGGSLFESASISNIPKNNLNSIGTTLTGALLVQDMTEDLVTDTNKGNFNPLKSYSSVQIEALAKRYASKFRKLVDPLLEKNQQL